MSFSIDLRLEDFYLAGESVSLSLPASWPEFVRSAATVGRDVSWTRRGVGTTLLRYERTWRQYMLSASLKQHDAFSTTGSAQRTKAYETLDPSEKGAISFFLGQATANTLPRSSSVASSLLTWTRRWRDVGSRSQGSGLTSSGSVVMVEHSSSKRRAVRTDTPKHCSRTARSRLSRYQPSMVGRRCVTSPRPTSLDRDLRVVPCATRRRISYQA